MIEKKAVIKENNTRVSKGVVSLCGMPNCCPCIDFTTPHYAVVRDSSGGEVLYMACEWHELLRCLKKSHSIVRFSGDRVYVSDRLHDEWSLTIAEWTEFQRLFILNHSV